MIMEIERIVAEDGVHVASGYYDTHSQETWVENVDENGQANGEMW